MKWDGSSTDEKSRSPHAGVLEVDSRSALPLPGQELWDPQMWIQVLGPSAFLCLSFLVCVYLLESENLMR